MKDNDKINYHQSLILVKHLTSILAGQAACIADQADCIKTASAIAGTLQHGLTARIEAEQAVAKPTQPVTHARVQALLALAPDVKPAVAAMILGITATAFRYHRKQLKTK
ncbi:MAG: hypothetical protein KDJ31_04790 [Candidatus Competibacteraceae bacterium]|nr:hypothetical protein [Candidatus Competibacteraceae bacterium]MCB1820706.1 hypothetical protein [Candidatus Competibacteraceae bacterium]